MLKYVQMHEIQQFLDACKMAAPDYQPELVFIVVKKRINTKLYHYLVSLQKRN